MEYGIDSIIAVLLMILHIVLMAHTFVEPTLLLVLFDWIAPAIFILTILWLLIIGWDYAIQAWFIFLHIITNFVAIVVSAWAFVVGMGEAAYASIQAWGSAQLASTLALVGIGLETASGLASTLASGIGSILVALGYGFGSVAVLLLNLIAALTSGLTVLAGATQSIGTLAGGAAALLALPFIVMMLLTLSVYLVYLISRIILWLTYPLWGASWLLGWITKMLVGCVTLAFYIERSVERRPSISLNWDGTQWTIAA